MLDYKNNQLFVESSKLKSGKVSWRSPSNLALIKYWGKHGRQLPRNPSISFTLDQAFTETSVEYAPKEMADGGVSLTFYFDSQPNEPFKTKVLAFLNSITDIFPFLKQLNLTIRSSNSFPHSSGIASSASSMSALALCLCSMERLFFGTLENESDFLQKASFIARLGSGSACRSVYDTVAVWGESGEIESSSNLFAIPYKSNVHEVFHTFHDDILIASKQEKSVSSRAGHSLMEGNIYAENRYQQARERLHTLLGALKTGDLESFGWITENEALTLHALMMTSNPSYILIRPNSLKMIERVRTYRESSQNPIYFSLDAGPNLHLLYPDSIASTIQSFIKSELLQYCENGEVIRDKVGKGPVQL